MAEAAYSKPEFEAELREQVSQCFHDPLRHNMLVFPWGEENTPLAQYNGPRDWQAEELAALGEHLRNPETRFDPYQVGVCSGHGVGKSAEIAFVIKWALDTCADTRVVVTANTETQMRTKTVPEVSLWCQRALTAHWFHNTATAIYSVEKGHEKNWRCDFIPWSKNNTEAFAGLHNVGRRIVLIFEEASGIDDAVWEVAEGALTDLNTEIIWVAFGNPTRNTGRFRECFRRHRKYWRTRHLDSRDVEGTNTKYLNRIIEQYGEDSDQARIRVKGQFPDQSASQLFSTADVERAFGKHLKPEAYEFAPKIISVDPAWMGDDDFVIGIRQGLKFDVLESFGKNDNDILMANKIARYEDEHDADAVFIDAGYGTGIVSAGKTMGRSWQLVWFGEASVRPDCFNKRAEMHVEVRDWLKQGGVIPNEQRLYDEMIATETVPTYDGKYKLPAKDDVKEEIGRSPNFLDCLAISFAFPVTKKQPVVDSRGLPLSGYQMPVPESNDYNPLDQLD